MSAVICWEPVAKEKANRLKVGSPSLFLEALECGLGRDSGEFGQGDLERLRGMASMIKGDANPFNEMVELIELHGAIRIWGEY